MALFKLNNFISLGCSTYPIAATWQAALDPEFTQILDETINDKNAVEIWNTPLPKLDGSGYHADLDKVYVRAKWHVENGVSDWFVLPVSNQNDQEVIVTKHGEVIETFNSLEAGMQ